ncbi:MAG: HEAT repeat domain-containing protein [Bacteroidota bacterium]|nr:HEAT repeat domain-containing protein [Bacteroidota bacterium]
MKKKKLFVCISILLGLIIVGFISIYIWIDVDIKKNIKIAQERYPGTAEDALLSYLADTTNSPRNRSRIAIWTLGQIESKKALPVLEGLYKNDPDGKTCYGKHDYVLCQHEIHKALYAIKVNWLPLHAHLNK